MEGKVSGTFGGPKKQKGETHVEEKRISPLRAIRLKCLDCSCGSINEVQLCTHTPRHEPTAAQLEALRNGRVAFGSVDKPGIF